MLPIQQILSDIQSQQLKNGQVATIDLKLSISRQYIPPRVEGNSTVSSTNVRQTERTANRPIPTFPLAEVEAATRKTERRTTLHRIANFSPVFSHHLRLLAILISIGIFSLCLGLESTMFPVVAPKISNEFGSLRYIGWYGSANLLASSVMEPIFSYVLTVSSRSARWLDVLRMIFLLTGWLTSGFSHSPTVMIVGRIISGFGVAGAPCGTLRASNPLLKSMASRKLTSRSSFATALIYGLSQTGGLFFAGTLADRSRWRWCFYVLSGLIVIPTLAIAMINILTSEPLPNHISGSDSSPSHDPSERRPRNRTPTSNSSASMGQPDGPLADLNLSSAGDGRRERRPRNRSPSVNYSFSMSQLDEPRSIQPDRLASDSQHEQSQDERSQHERIPRYGLSDWDEDETANSHPVRRPRSPFPKVVRYIGCAALYLTAGVLFLLAINWGIFGDRRHIEYRAVISISVFAILTIGLIVVLYLWGPDPKRHFRNASRSQARLLFLWESFVPGLSVGMSFRPLLYNLPIWLQALRASSATTASAYFMPTVVLYSAGFFIRPVYTLMRKTYFRRVRENHNSDTADTRRKLHFDFSQIFSLVSLVVMATGAGLLSTLQPTSYFDKIIGYQVLFGLGSGLIRSNSALFRASEYYGGAIAIGLGQLFFQNYHLNDTLAQVVLAKEDFNSNGHPKSIHPLLQIYNTALTRTFIISVVASALGAYASFWAFIKWGVSRDSFDPDTELVELPGPRRDVRSPSD
ncbi:hypothetical protein BCR34DRAFT_206528 [Clohesyomyces aquaticus]|uniref:Major facilitator superfamily domain-containing protein n=1 Tax=Clohesyomyces aquaticus TaxID=1231657 RepID=A0A1Y2A9B8_9PLEO|nr:hypothetical protein BCR34DRAFT_206528 [Clohesyomyces aquaticus]